jgi:hypothetical protein
MDLTIHFCFSILDHATQLLRLEMIMKLEYKIALVTGSMSRTDAATARALAREGGQAIGVRSERSAPSRRRDTTDDP